MPSTDAVQKPYKRPTEYWCNTPEQVMLIEAALDMYEASLSEMAKPDSSAVTLFRDLLHFVDYETHLNSHKSWPHMRDRIEAFIRSGNVKSGSGE